MDKKPQSGCHHLTCCDDDELVTALLGHPDLADFRHHHQSDTRTFSCPTCLLSVLWVMRTGGSWRALPDRFGPWSTVAGWYHRWRHDGVWERIRQVLLASDVPFFSSA